ncbi:hypothetical protein, partial [Streptococcus suis]|uniref:hypothetical protein n=1 Tax=Streptococcus suis TaxID=1307 RepID=UPI00137AE89C
KESLSRLEVELVETQNKLQNLLGQIELLKADQSIEKAEIFFNQIDVNYEEIETRIEIITKELKELQSFIKLKLSENSEVVDRMSQNIIRFSK